MGSTIFSVRGSRVKGYGTNAKGARFPIYDFVTRSKVVKTIMNGLGDLPITSADKLYQIKANLSTSLVAATYRESGKIRESSVDQIAKSLFSHIVQAVGIKNLKALGINHKQGEDGSSYQKRVEEFLKAKIKSVITSSDLISPTNALRVIKMLQAAGSLMAKLSSSSFKTDGIFRMFQQGITAVKIGDGMDVFVVSQGHQKVMNTKEGPEDKEPKGDVAHFLFINNLIARCYKETSPGGKGAFLEILMKVKFWDGKWQDYGFSRALVQEHLKTAGIKELRSKDKDGNVGELANILSEGVLGRAYLNEKQLDELCDTIYKDFKKNKLSDPNDHKYDEQYKALLSQIKTKAQTAINGLYADATRKESSAKALSAKHIPDISKFINDDMKNFAVVIKNYSDSLEMRDKENGSANDHFFSMIYLNGENEFIPYAIVHNYETTESKNDKLFSNENDLNLYTNTMNQINNTLNMSLRLRQNEAEIKLDSKQKNSLFKMSNVMMNEGTQLIDRIKALPEILRELCKKGEEEKNATVFMVNKVFQEGADKKDNKYEMNIVGTTLKDDATKEFITDTVNLKEEDGKPITKLSGCVLRSKQILFIDKGEACIIESFGGKDRQAKLDFEALPKELEGAKEALIDMQVKKASNIILPMLSGEKELGVIILSGDKLTLDDVNLLRQASNTIVLSTMNTVQLKALTLADVEYRKLNRELEIRSRTDDLTKLLRRHPFEAAMQEAIQKSKEFNYSVSVMMIDIDFFKSINDKYGHQTGDKILEEVSAEIKQLFKEEAEKNGDVDESIIGRYGGEEICVILPRFEKGFEHEGANGLGLKLLKFISSKKRITHDGKPFEKEVTITIGISALPKDVDRDAPKAAEKAIDAADHALIAGKKRRNSCYTYNKDVHIEAENEKKKQAEAKVTVKMLLIQAKDAINAGDLEKAVQLLDDAEKQMDLIR